MTLFGFCAAFGSESDVALLNPPPHSQWGYAIVDAKNGAMLDENNGRQFLIPASVIKLLTTGRAMDKLGPWRRFPTVLYRTGKIEKGVLHGDLWIRGGGNPALGSERDVPSQRAEVVFTIFLRALKQAGILAVDGQIHGDGGLFDPEGPELGALWEDVGNYYGASPSGLCFHDNQYWLQLSRDSDKNKTLITTDTRPHNTGVSFFQVKANTSGTGGGDSCYILGAFRNTPRLVTGICPLEKKPLEIKGSLPDPAWTCAREFRDFLRNRGVAVKDSDDEPSDEPLPDAIPLPADTLRLAEHASPPLKDIIASIHATSDNLYATQLLILSADSGQPRNSAGGLHGLRAWLGAQSISNLLSEIHLEDGNGLSLRNQLTTAALAQALASFANKPWFPIWRETLTGGTARSFKVSGYGENLRGKLWVKTGSMNNVAALAGYIHARSGRLIAFTIVINRFDEPASAVRNQWGALLHSWWKRY